MIIRANTFVGLSAFWRKRPRANARLPAGMAPTVTPLARASTSRGLRASEALPERQAPTAIMASKGHAGLFFAKFQTRLARDPRAYVLYERPRENE
jgi:hypothetical protein